MSTLSKAVVMRPAAAVAIALLSLSLSACGERAAEASTSAEHRHDALAAPDTHDGHDTHQAHGDDVLPVAERAKALTLYVCPMHPHVQQPEPGQCPICGMHLVPRSVEPEPESAAPAAAVTVPAALQQSLGIRMVKPVRETVRPSVRVPARVLADADRQVRVTARVEGWVEHLQVRAVGQRIVAGAVIAEVYAPELVETQQELLLSPETTAAAAERLRRLGIAERDITALRESGKAQRRLPLRSPVAGVVTRLPLREGARIGPETVLLELAPQDSVWIEAQVLPAQLAQLGRVQGAHLSQPGVAAAQWHLGAGEPVPIVDATTQAMPVRFALAAEGAPPLGSWLDAELLGPNRDGVLLLPAEAVIRTPEGDRVVVRESETRFAVRSVRLGQRYGARVEVVDGLRGDESVVASGQFLLDGEASLRAGLQRLQGEAAADPHAGHRP